MLGVFIGFIAGAAFVVFVARNTRIAAKGTLLNRVHIAVVGPWRPK